MSLVQCTCENSPERYRRSSWSSMRLRTAWCLIECQAWSDRSNNMSEFIVFTVCELSLHDRQYNGLVHRWLRLAGVPSISITDIRCSQMSSDFPNTSVPLDCWWQHDPQFIICIHYQQGLAQEFWITFSNMTSWIEVTVQLQCTCMIFFRAALWSSCSATRRLCSVTRRLCASRKALASSCVFLRSTIYKSDRVRLRPCVALTHMQALAETIILNQV
jgi:hypothetical protein